MGARTWTLRVGLLIVGAASSSHAWTGSAMYLRHADSCARRGAAWCSHRHMTHMTMSSSGVRDAKRQARVARSCAVASHLSLPPRLTVRLPLVAAPSHCLSVAASRFSPLIRRNRCRSARGCAGESSCRQRRARRRSARSDCAPHCRGDRPVRHVQRAVQDGCWQAGVRDHAASISACKHA